MPDGPPAAHAVVRGNVVTGATEDDVLVEPTAGDVALERNVARAAGDDGIDVQSAATVLTRNFAFGNGDLGIDAVAGVSDGGGTRARKRQTRCSAQA